MSLVKPLTEEIAAKVIRGEFIPCSYIHNYSCLRCAIFKFVSVLKLASAFYFPVHFIPVLLFKRKKLRER